MFSTNAFGECLRRLLKKEREVADIRSKNIRPKGIRLKGIRLKDILPLSYLFLTSLNSS
jgi:hypothetical protein